MFLCTLPVPSLARSHQERIFAAGWGEGVLGVGLGAPGVIASDTHLLAIDVEPDHVFLLGDILLQGGPLGGIGDEVGMDRLPVEFVYKGSSFKTLSVTPELSLTNFPALAPAASSTSR